MNLVLVKDFNQRWLRNMSPCREGREYAESQTSATEGWRNCPRVDWLCWLERQVIGPMMCDFDIPTARGDRDIQDFVTRHCLFQLALLLDLNQRSHDCSKTGRLMATLPDLDGINPLVAAWYQHNFSKPSSEALLQGLNQIRDAYLTVAGNRRKAGTTYASVSVLHSVNQALIFTIRVLESLMSFDPQQYHDRSSVRQLLDYTNIATSTVWAHRSEIQAFAILGNEASESARAGLELDAQWAAQGVRIFHLYIKCPFA